MKETTKTDEQNFFTKTDLKERGWTDSAITKFLNSFDLEKRNPTYPKSATVKLFETNRVIKAEETDEWQSWRKKLDESSKRRKVTIKKRELQKVADNIEFAKTCPITVPDLNIREIKDEAIIKFNEKKGYEWERDQEWFNRVGHEEYRSLGQNYFDFEAENEPVYLSISDDPNDVNKVTVKYIMKSCMDFDDNSMGDDESRRILFGRYVKEIVSKYPELEYK